MTVEMKSVHYACVFSDKPKQENDWWRQIIKICCHRVRSIALF